MARSRKQRGALASGITFAFFMGEAIIHYNMGQKADNPDHKFELPPLPELGKMALVVGAFSILSGAVIGMVD
tara:strand:+ start:423 stop:638 length:216 start_codon:yes stop_codon:yes gene_type:complete